MDSLSIETVQQIEEIHAAWIGLELAQDTSGMLELCADNIELQPPNEAPVQGRNAVLAYLAQGTAKVCSIEISDLRIGGSSYFASLTANYRSTFYLPGDPVPRQAAGTHTWNLSKRSDRWSIVRISWSSGL